MFYLKDFIVRIESILATSNPGTLVPMFDAKRRNPVFITSWMILIFESLRRLIVWMPTAFCGVTLIDTLVARDQDEEMLPLLERAPSLTKMLLMIRVSSR